MSKNNLSLADAAVEIKQGESIYDACNLLEEKYPGLKCCGDEWYLSENGVYRLHDTDLVSPEALSVLTKKKHSDAMAQQVIRTLQSRKQVPKESLKSFTQFEDARRESVLLCARNGVVRVTANEVTLLPHSMDYCFGRQLAAAYDVDARCDCFDDTVAFALPDPEDQELLLAFSGGYTLYPSNELETFLVVYGAGGTGKSTVFSGFAEVLGRENVTTLKFSELCGDGPGYALPTLQRAGLNLGAEAAQGELQESDILKRLVEGSEITVRGIYNRPFPMRDYHVKICVLGNYLPKFKSGTDAELRRLRILHFKNQHEDIDPRLAIKIGAERDCIFSKRMVPALQYVLRKKFIPEGGTASKVIFESFKISHDPYKTFLDSCCNRVKVLDKDCDGFRELKDYIYGAWCCFIEDNDLSDKLRDESWFWRRVKTRWPEFEDYKPHDQPRYILGLKLKEGVRIVPETVSPAEKRRQFVEYEH